MKAEFRRIEAIRKLLHQPKHGVRVGIGDDCAVLDGPRRSLVLTTDALIEGVHFPPVKGKDLERLGFRSMAANVSDIASMGAKPLWFVVSLAAPDSFTDRGVLALYAGMERAAQRWGYDIVGGDTCRSPGPLYITITAIGAALPRGPLLRTGAREGDVVATTGTPGDSAACLALILKPIETCPPTGPRHARATAPEGAAGRELRERQILPVDEREYLARRFWEPDARVEEGLVLARSGACHACIDVSDGLGQDLGHLARAAGLRARIRLSDIPRSRALQQIADLSDSPGGGTSTIDHRPSTVASRGDVSWAERVLRWQLSGGEDYELIAAIDPERFDGVRRNFRRRGLAPITAIGRFEKGVGVIADETGQRLDWAGYSHFQEAHLHS